ncbi:hypothetical protein PR048_026904 [Dryococelus australis]|uniref:HTH psq-type domain-containing protein n=1 Tax=Dryococelus australis TaxID=614101 RepID=A0ABQ9GML1_9NEOP|nr:hypothetical protein PR048_026904 [Dryococelus australis]
MMKSVKATKDYKLPLSTAANTFNVPRNTLRWRACSNVSMAKLGQRIFSRTAEKQPVTHLLKLDSLGYGLTFKDLRTLVYRLVFANELKNPFNNEPEMAWKEWFRGFLSCHRALSVSVSEALSFTRARGLFKNKTSQFYDNLSEFLDI